MYDEYLRLDYDIDDYEDLPSLESEPIEEIWQCDCSNGCADCLL